MADRVDFIDDLIEYNQRPHPRQRVLRDRLHPLDAYDDVDIYERLRFKRHGIIRITDMLAADIQHNVYERCDSPESPKFALPRNAVHSNHPCW